MPSMRGVVLVCAAAVAAVVAPAYAAPPIQLPALTRVASKLSGLKAKQRIKVKVKRGAAMDAAALQLLDRDYPVDQQRYDETVYRFLGLLAENERLRPSVVATYAKGVRGVYDPVSRTLYVRQGASRAAVLHEIVHALQDQTFDLRRVVDMRRGRRDAGFGASAAVEGSALLATQVVAGRRLASHAGSRIRMFLDLERAFPYTTGLRFASTLKHLGGNRAVHSSLRSLPETTEQVFHIDAYLSREEPVAIALPPSAAGFARTREDTFGELDVRALLAIYQIARLDHVGEGWGGGRTAVYRDRAGAEALIVALDWDTGSDAAEWAEAVTLYVNEAFDADTPGPAPIARCAASACWSVGGRSIAFRRHGRRTAIVFAPSVAAADAIAGAVLTIG